MGKNRCIRTNYDPTSSWPFLKICCSILYCSHMQKFCIRRRTWFKFVLCGIFVHHQVAEQTLFRPQVQKKAPIASTLGVFYRTSIIYHEYLFSPLFWNFFLQYSSLNPTRNTRIFSEGSRFEWPIIGSPKIIVHQYTKPLRHISAASWITNNSIWDHHETSLMDLESRTRSHTQSPSCNANKPNLHPPAENS